MTQPPEPIDALVVILQDDPDVAAIAAARVYGGELPRDINTDMPEASVVLTPAGGGALGRAYQQYGDVRVDVTCYGSTAREAARLQTAVYQAFKQLQRTVAAGCLVHWARRSAGAVQGRDPTTQWPSTMSTYQVLVSEISVD